MPGNLTSGADYGDGQNGNCGTPTPSYAIVVQANNGGTTPESIPLEEDADSPEIERAEQATITHRFTMSWQEALNHIQFLGRGTLFMDSFGNVTKVLSSKIQRQPGRRATLIIIAEGLSFDSPPDRFEITPVELGLNILKFPRYFYSLFPSNTTDAALNQQVIRLLQNYFENPNPQFRQYWEAQINYSFGHRGSLNAQNAIIPQAAYAPGSDPTATIVPISGTDLAKAAALEIMNKYWKGEETPYVVGYQMVWTVYYWRPQYLNPGGYTEDPIFNPILQVPLYFVSPAWPPSTEAIITDLMAIYNPQCYSTTGYSGGGINISWLRKADLVEEERTWFKHVRTWIGSAVGYWDPDIYAASHRPTVPDDYSVASSSPPIITRPNGLPSQ